MTAQDYIENSNMEFYNMTFHEKGLVEISYDDLGDLMESYAKCYLHNVVGRFYSARGTCGITDGVEVKGRLTKIDEWGAYLTCERGITHLCNERTLNAL